MKYVFFIAFVFISVLSCKDSGKGELENRHLVAKVNGSFLYEDELKDLVPPGTASKDSVSMVKKFIHSWVQEMLVLQLAETNLSKEQKNVEKQLQAYRNSLVIYAFEKELVQQKLDTNIMDNEVEKYYDEHKNNFELRDNIIRVTYIKVSRKAPQIDNVRKWYKSDIDKDLKQLQSYCYQFADNFYFDDKSWLLFNDLLKEIPIKTYNEELFLQNNRFVEVADSSSIFFVNIKGFKIKNTLSPLAFEREKIKNILLNKRKVELITKMKTDLYRKAEAEKEFEIFVK